MGKYRIMEVKRAPDLFVRKGHFFYLPGGKLLRVWPLCSLLRITASCLSSRLHVYLEIIKKLINIIETKLTNTEQKIS